MGHCDDRRTLQMLVLQMNLYIYIYFTFEAQSFQSRLHLQRMMGQGFFFPNRDMAGLKDPIVCQDAIQIFFFQTY